MTRASGSLELERLEDDMVDKLSCVALYGYLKSKQECEQCVVDSEECADH